LAYIYKITHLVNNKKYIGQTWNYDKRIKEHFNGYGSAKLLKLAIEKYGKDEFKVDIVCKVKSQFLLDKVEILMIQMCNSLQPNGYNIALGGFATGKHSEETKKLIGSYHKGKIISKETRDKLSLANKGNIVSQETKEKISNFHKNKIKEIFIFDYYTHNLVRIFKNWYDVKMNENIPCEVIYRSVNDNGTFLFKDRRSYASFTNEPRIISKTYGKPCILIFENGETKKFISLATATKELNLQRGIMDSLVRGKSQTSKYTNNKGKIIKFTAKYI
jgi:group I intron endonuclease